MKGCRAAKKTKARQRLAPSDRRLGLVRAASRLLTERGLDGLQHADIAEAAGVTRPVVYKFFADRREVVTAVLDDFTAELTSRFVAAASRGFPGTMAEATRVFIDAICDTIESRGAGPWRLLDARSHDPAIAAIAHAAQERLVAPWRARIAEATGARPREVVTVSDMLVAAGRAVLELWYDGKLTRAEAARDATRGVSALLEAFTRA